jgi:glycosyltransferase involved in cell wall biosynthesis
MLVSPFVNPFPQPFVNPMPQLQGTVTPGASRGLPAPPETLLPRALNYYADYSGCGFWRMIWPEHVINAHQKMVVHGSTVMCFDPNYFRGVKAVRIQRQATEHQLRFIQFLKQISQEHKFRLIYEIDDLVFAEDIPEYNKFKPAFTDPKIRQTAQAIMAMCDEITVTNKFMKDYYAEKTGNKNITVIPNYPPKFWMGQFYNEKRLSENFDRFQKKPRVLYAGSGAHFDVENRVGQNDDFAHVNRIIESTIDKYQWVFLGAFPLPLQHLVASGKVEFHPWERTYTYAEKIYNLNINAMVAPLQDNTFNRAKSDLKLVEASCFGIPIVCQDMCTYEDATFKFKTGDEMVDQLDVILGKKGKYMNLSAKARKFADSRWLELDQNIDKYVELYTHPYGDPNRKLINKLNGL